MFWYQLRDVSKKIGGVSGGAVIELQTHYICLVDSKKNLAQWHLGVSKDNIGIEEALTR